MQRGATDGDDEDEGRGWPRAVRRRPSASAVAGRAARITVWGVVHFLFGLAQQLAELLAPLAFVVGAGWYALPRALGLIQTGDGQMQDILNGVENHVPASVAVGSHVLTPGGLVLDGILLMAVAAGLSTLSAILARELTRAG